MHLYHHKFTISNYVIDHKQLVMSYDASRLIRTKEILQKVPIKFQLNIKYDKLEGLLFLTLWMS